MAVCKGALRNSAYLLSCAGESFFHQGFYADPYPSMDPGANETAITSGLRGGAFFIENKGCKL
jgi:hypothetical protein